MINICTLCDKNYLLKGLAMRQSLIDLKVDYRIYWLCLDQETYRVVGKLDNVLALELSVYEQEDEQLRKAQSNPASRYGSQRDNYIWSLTPYFVNDVLTKYIKAGEHLMYVDSDIYFYLSPQVILDVIGDKSIGIHTHRFGPSRKKLDVGWYNVGVTVFRKDTVGIMASNMWKSWVMNTDNDFYQEYGTCGDQKYLELFPTQFPTRVCVFDEHSSISHRAPWCCDEDNKPVVFFHFSHFNCDLKNNTWKDSIHGEWRPAALKHIRPYYENYFQAIKQIQHICIELLRK